jgi:hypothetical protein
MARYQLTELSFIGGSLRDAGYEFEVDDKVKPGTHWQPLDAAAKKAFKDAGFTEVGLVDPMLVMTPMDGDDPTKFGGSPREPSGMAIRPEGAPGQA